MKKRNLPTLFSYLVGYYGVLQSFHLLLLTRAGGFLVQGREIPFPAPPPPGGWPETALPYLLGMGLVDVFAIGLGLVFVYIFYARNLTQITVGLISLTAAISSGIVYLVGTIPSGAWEANILAYLSVLLLFSPVIPLYYLLIKQALQSE